jgi:hypothetical protein
LFDEIEQIYEFLVQYPTCNKDQKILLLQNLSALEEKKKKRILPLASFASRSFASTISIFKIKIGG